MDFENKKILYVFNSGRKDRINKNKNFPNDFYYYYFQLKDKAFDVNAIELSESGDTSLLLSVIKNFEKIFIKYWNIPFYGSKIFSLKNFLKIIKSNILIITNETIAYTLLLLPISIKRKTSVVFVMGLFQNFEKNKFNNYLIKKIIIKYKKFIFLSKVELEYAQNLFPNFSFKFFHIPFTIDTNFWSTKSKNEYKKEILFIGNDLNRDYKKLLDIVDKLPQYKFTIVTQRIENTKLPKNINLINGSWSSDTLNDLQLKKIYENALISLIPTKKTIQPTGQSVLLQSMSMGVPVMVSFDENFWGQEYFTDTKDIIYVKENQDWVKEILFYLNNSENLKKISFHAKETIFEKFNQENYLQKFIEILKL